MNKFLTLLFVLSFSFFAPAASVRFTVQNSQTVTQSGRRVLITPNGISTNSANLVTADQRMYVTDTNGQFTVTNMVPQYYLVEVQKPPASSLFWILLTNSVTSTNVLEASALVVPTTDVPSGLTYTRSQVDALIAAGGGGGGTNGLTYNFNSGQFTVSGTTNIALNPTNWTDADAILAADLQSQVNSAYYAMLADLAAFGTIATNTFATLIGLATQGTAVTNFTLAQIASGGVVATNTFATIAGLAAQGTVNTNTFATQTALATQGTTISNVFQTQSASVTQSNNILSAFQTGNTLFVRTNGNDSTGLRGRSDKPFATPFGAKTNALVGDLIDVGPGTYRSGITNIGFSGTYFFRNPIFIWNEKVDGGGWGIVDERASNVAITNSTFGRLHIQYCNSTNFIFDAGCGVTANTNAHYAIIFTNVLSEIKWEAATTIGIYGVGSPFALDIQNWKSNSFFHLEESYNLNPLNYIIVTNCPVVPGEEIVISTGANNINWGLGTGSVYGKRTGIGMTGYCLQTYSKSASDNDNLFLSFDYMEGKHYIVGASKNYKVWCVAKEYKSSTGVATDLFDFWGAGYHYYAGQKAGVTGPGFVIRSENDSISADTNLTVWFNIDKISGTNGFISANRGELRGRIGHMQLTGTQKAAGIKNSGGFISLSGENVEGNTNAIHHVSGTTQLRGYTLTATNGAAILTNAPGLVLQNIRVAGTNFNTGEVTGSDATLTNGLVTLSQLNTKQPANVTLTNLAALANGAGVLTNDGSGTLTWVPVAGGGGGISTTNGVTKGDLAVYNGTNWTRQATGTNGQLLAVNPASATGYSFSNHTANANTFSFSTLSPTGGTNFVIDLTGAVYQSILATNNVFITGATNSPGAASIPIRASGGNRTFHAPTNMNWLATNGLTVSGIYYTATITNIAWVSMVKLAADPTNTFISFTLTK